mgnify:CR=1 FL=1
MRPQALNDLIRILELLGRQIAVIEYPVILFPMLMLASQNVCDGMVGKKNVAEMR